MSAEHAPIVPISPVEPASASAVILKRLVDRRATLKADAEYIAGEIEALDGQVIELLGGQVGTHDVDGTKVEIREYSRTDYKALEAKYPAAEYPQLYTTVTALDQGVVKKQFAPAALDEFKVTGKKSVVIK
jgi:hypothetical protein